MFAKRNQIYIGSLEEPDYYFENDQIKSCPVTQSVAMVGQELAIDTFSPVVSDASENLLDIVHFRSSDGREIETGVGEIYAVDISVRTEAPPLIEVEDGTPLWYFHNEELVGKFFISSVKRLARNSFQIESVSAIGKLDKMYHGGGLFLGSTFGEVLEHILASGIHGPGDPLNPHPPVIEYAIDDDVAQLPVSGWLPYASKRNNLYQLIFSNGVNIVKNIDGNPRFTFIYTGVDTATPIEDSRLFYGGDVEYTKPYSKVSIMEHTYTALTDGVEPVTLYDNSLGTAVSNEEIWFDNAPIIVSSLVATENLTIVSATENSAIISGNGILTGIPYTHTTRTVSRNNTASGNEKVVSVGDCTMVNLINSENLLNRLYAFYCPESYIKKITNSIRFTKERCGKAYIFKNPHGEEEVVYLATMDSLASSFVKSDCEWYANYAPAGQEGLYQHVAIITPVENPETGELVYTGDWELPEGVDQIKVVLIGGGTGGSSGYPGENGQDAETYTDVETTADLSAVWFGAEGGEGGKGGPGGAPGRVKVVTIENPASSFHYELGQGGEGGEPTGQIPDPVEGEDQQTVEPNAGTAGTATTFGIYSTDDEDGYLPTGGVYEQMSDAFYALPGKTGRRGGKGGARKVTGGGSFNWVTDGENVTDSEGTTYHGGATGEILTETSDLPEAVLKAYGGNGAGAAIGLDRADNPDMDGKSDQEASWEVREDGGNGL